MVYFKRNWIKLFFVLTGIFSVVWFLIRVIPKPGRASYPCQREAFPIASAFVIWLLGSVAAFSSLKKAKKLYTNRKVASIALFATGVVLYLLSYILFPTESIFAKTKSTILAEPALKASYNVINDNSIDPEASVAIIKSEKSKVSEIDKDEVESLVREAVDLAGGLGSIVKDGDNVVLKPNIVVYDYRGSALPVEGNGMVTDWRVVAATAKIVRELNPNGKIIVMEGTASTSTLEAYEVLNYTKEYIPEVDTFMAMEESSGNYQEFNSNRLVGVTIPDSVKLYPDNLKRYNSAMYYYNKIYYNADVLISLPVLKNHATAGTTGAVKNLGIGATPTNIYGADDGNYNNGRWYAPAGEKPSISHVALELHRWIHDYYYARPADFAIMDGLQGYAYGPNYNNKPADGWGIQNHQQNMRVLLASKDPVALDAIEALISGDDPLKVSHLVYLNNDGIGCADANAIKVLGTRVHAIKKNFPHVVNKSNSDATDFKAPGAGVHYVNYAGNTLNFSLTNSNDVTKVEVDIDGQSYKKIIIGGFDNISIDLNDFTITDSLLTIYAQDRFLNSDVLMIRGNFAASTTAVKSELTDNSFILYPNPVRDYVNIHLNSPLTGLVYIEITDQAGRQVYKTSEIKQAVDYKTTINLSRLSKGYYVVTVNAEGTAISKKLFKE